WVVRRPTHRPDGLDGVFPLSPSLDAVGWIAPVPGGPAGPGDRCCAVWSGTEHTRPATRRGRPADGGAVVSDRRSSGRAPPVAPLGI
ncbi:hypothetical protein ACWDUX_32805, partial [Streptomyces sp. NPDC003444]